MLYTVLITLIRAPFCYRPDRDLLRAGEALPARGREGAHMTQQPRRRKTMQRPLAERDPTGRPPCTAHTPRQSTARRFSIQGRAALGERPSPRASSTTAAPSHRSGTLKSCGLPHAKHPVGWCPPTFIWPLQGQRQTMTRAEPFPPGCGRCVQPWPLSHTLCKPPSFVPLQFPVWSHCQRVRILTALSVLRII